MNTTDVLTIDRWTDDPRDSVDANAIPVTSMPAMADVRFRASHPLAFQLSHMGAGLGWHGAVTASCPSPQVECTR